MRNDFAHSDFMENCILECGSAMSGLDLKNTDYGQAWKNDMQNLFADPNRNYSYNTMVNEYAHSNFMRNRIIEIAQQKNLQLTETTIQQKQNLIEQQGYDKVQQSFNQTYDLYKNTIESEHASDRVKINSDHFVNYQQMIIQGKSHEEIINAVKYDLYQDIGGPVAKLGKTEWDRKSMAYAEQMGVNKKALAAVCEIESGCRDITSVHGTISGPFQMTQATYKDSIQEAVKENPGLNLTEDQIENGHDIPEIQAIAATQYLKDAANTVKSADIPNPTALQTRGYYQFGPKYGKLIATANPNDTMGSILTSTPNKIFINNGITKETTVGEWRDMVRKRMGGFADESILNH